MGTILSRIILPKSDELPKRDLYYRSNKKVVLNQKALQLAKDSIVVFDTYFNSFVYSKYLNYTSLRNVCFSVCLLGEVLVKIICCDSDNQEKILFKKQIVGVGKNVRLSKIDLSSLPLDGMLFLKIEVLSNTAVFIHGWVETDEIPLNYVKVAAVFCTFHREEYIIRNLKMIEQDIWDNHDFSSEDSLYVYVVDNGKTLMPEENEHLKILHNRNLGGSGGFTRGFIEAYKQGDKFTHILFMDDDICFEPEILIKTIQILRFAKKMEKPLCIGGQMLEEDRPTKQFEAGAFYKNGRLVPVNRGIDLADRFNLLLNITERCVQYNAWWYCCIPLCLADKIGLSMPFFIKSDDVEYGLRMQANVLLMNGIGVWHKAFDQKYSPHLEYYIKRNELVVSALYDNGAGVLASIWKLLRAAAKAILLGNPLSVDFMLMAYRDFLRGIDFFYSVDGERLNDVLLDMRKKKPKSRFVSLCTYPFRMLPIFLKIALKYKVLQQQYKNGFKNLTTIEAWCERLGIDKVD